MPGNILNADTMFPSFRDDETSEQKLDKVTNYLYMLLEQLRYSLANLDAENFNDTGLREIAEGISRPLQTEFEDELAKTAALIEGFSNEFGSQITELTEWKTGAERSIASVQQKANANGADITALTQWKSGAEQSIASVQQKANANGADITSLLSWKNTANSEISGLKSTTATIKQTADSAGASISQIVEAVGKNGKVNAASIVAAVNSAGSSVKIDADHLDVDAIAVFKNTANGEGVTTINGDDIVLVADAYGDAISGLTFYKWRYTDTIEKDNELDNMFRIRTIDNESDNDNYARYAAQIQTLSAFENNQKYNVALKLLSDGSMSLESGFSIYMYADTYCVMEADQNVRIRPLRSYSGATELTSAATADYVFCTNGIYVGGIRVLNPNYEFKSSGIYYKGTLMIETP